MDSSKVLETLNNLNDHWTTCKSFTLEGNDLLEKVDRIWETLQGFPMNPGSSINPTAWGTYTTDAETRSDIYMAMSWEMSGVYQAAMEDKAFKAYTHCSNMYVLIKQMGGAVEYSLTGQEVI